ncbi:MAG: CoA transferase [Mycobacterium sp.]|nr:CoA transferase [Mycobacterium sp.]
MGRPARTGFTSSAWLNLKEPEALKRAYELAADADVIVESYRPHKIANLGLSPEELAARRPASSTPPRSATATTDRGQSAVVSTWKRCASPGSPP